MNAARPLRLALSLLALSALGAACTESATIEYAFESEAVPTGDLTIDNIEGAVRLTAGPPGSPVRGTVRVIASGFKERIDAQNAAERTQLFEIFRAGDMTLEVRIPVEYNRFRFSTSLDLQVPEDVRVSVATDNGRVVIDRLLVDVVDTTNGDVVLSFTSGNTTIRTGEAPITVESHDGNIDARTVNAPIELISIRGNARALTTNGLIDARVTPPPGGDVFLATTNADVSVIIPRDFGSRVVANTTEDGIISVNNLGFFPSPSFPWQAEGTIGDGRGVVDVRTTIGDIFLSGR